MLKIFAAVWSGLLHATPLVAADVTCRKDIAPLWHAQCVACHGAQSPYLGASEEERQRNLKVFKTWIGKGGWILKRWEKRGAVAGISREELEKIQVKY